MKKLWLFSSIIALTLIFLAGCAGRRSPIDIINSQLKNAPDYSVILDDMEERGSVFKTYYHKYRILQDSNTYQSNWMQVTKKNYQNNQNFLGMTLVSKKNGKLSNSVGPPGYEHVGDKQYGNWQRSSSGTSFWVFYGQYRLFSDLLGGGRINRNDYNNYRTSRGSGRPYYGSRNQYGTKGSVTRTQKPNFYSRRTARARASKTSFSNRVNSRVGRSRVGVRSRSYGGGK